MDLCASRVAIGYPSDEQSLLYSSWTFLLLTARFDRFCLQAMSSTAVKFNKRNQSTKALSPTPQTIQWCQKVQEL